MADWQDRRDSLVEKLREYAGEPVLSAFRVLPRHLFLPDEPPEAAYDDRPIVTKRDPDGQPTSSSSQPAIMAVMLDQLDLRKGQRVLEIGAGTGFNAALIGHLVGETGEVVSLDLDADVVAAATEHLAAAGSTNVTVVRGDGADGYPQNAPYDRIIATVGVWDLEPAWLEQLGTHGRLVVPLDIRGVQQSVAFERENGRWVSRSVKPCGFMRLRGASAGPEESRVLRPDSGLTIIVPDARHADLDRIGALLDEPVVRRPSAVRTTPDEVFGGLSLWLAIHEPRWCSLAEHAERWLGAAPIVMQAGDRVTAGIVADGGLALLARRGPDSEYELEAAGYGPAGEVLADVLLWHVRDWDTAGRPGTGGLRLTAYPASTPDNDLVGMSVIDKRHTRLVIDQS